MLAAAGRADSVNSGSVVEILKHTTVALASNFVPRQWPLRHALTNWWLAARNDFADFAGTRVRHGVA